MNSNIDKIKTVIFTGDVFLNPSLKKWNKLENQFGSKIKIIVSPGNHDVGMGGEDNSLREAFDKTPYSNKYYPYLLKESNSFIIIEDSTINYGEIQDGLVNLINKIPTESSIFVFRHHIPIVELSPYSNTSINKSFSSLNELKDLVSKKVTFISGDSGNKIYHPRYTCQYSRNLKFITNGIGEFKKDTVLLLKNQKIFRYVLH